MTYLLLFLGLLGPMSLANAQHPALLPLPRELAWTQANFRVDGPITIWVNALAGQSVADSIAQFLRQSGRVNVVYNTSQSSLMSNRRIELWLEPGGPFREKPEGYSLTITKQSIVLKAATVQGLFWGYRTVQQLYRATPSPVFVGCVITDYPAFRVRGFMHDVGRSFIPIERLKQHIDRLSRYKINTFHWHLTEDLAWRLQSDSIPRLTEPSVTMRSPGQFYTKEQARDLVQFCQQRHVLLVPEIDMPGHSGAFKRATGHEMQSKLGKILVKKLLQEVCALFADYWT